MSEWPDETIDRLQARIDALQAELAAARQDCADLRATVADQARALDCQDAMLRVAAQERTELGHIDDWWSGEAWHQREQARYWRDRATRYQALWRRRHDQVKTIGHQPLCICVMGQTDDGDAWDALCAEPEERPL